jgi:hypothetical protein
MRTPLVRPLTLILLLSSPLVLAQEAPPPAPPPAEGAPPAPPAAAPAPGAEATPAAADPGATEALQAGKAGLRVHVITTRNTFESLVFDLFDVATGQVVITGRGVDEARGEQPRVLEVEPGTYKLVKAGEPMETPVDFATVELTAGRILDYVIVIDPDSKAFRGSGVMTNELPTGMEIVGIKVALNAGGTLLLNQKANPIGTTSGTTALIGLFGNFGLVFDKGPHFLTVNSDLQLNLTDPVTGSLLPTSDRLEASALYAYNINNPYFGPYVRAGVRTKIFPGYLYLESADTDTVTVQINRIGQPTETRAFGTEANPDNLRIKIAKPFAPFVMQEEVGGNLKAVDLDLLLFKLVVGTRIGFGFRQGFTNGLLVVDGTDEGPTVTLNEVDDYDTLGPVAGANASVTFARWLFGSAQFGMLVPLTDRDRAGDSFGERLLIDFSGTAGFKVPILTNLLTASFDYTFRLERDGYLTEETQFEHSLMARVNITLF